MSDISYELRALTTVAEALEGLDPEAAFRVLAWAVGKYVATPEQNEARKQVVREKVQAKP